MLDYLGKNWVAFAALLLAVPSAATELYRLMHRKRLKVELRTVTVGQPQSDGSTENRCHLAVLVSSINGSNGLENLTIERPPAKGQKGESVSTRSVPSIMAPDVPPQHVTDVFMFRCVLAEGETRTWDIDVETNSLGPLVQPTSAEPAPKNTESFRAVVTTVDGRTYYSNASSLWRPFIVPA